MDMWNAIVNVCRFDSLTLLNGDVNWPFLRAINSALAERFSQWFFFPSLVHLRVNNPDYWHCVERTDFSSNIIPHLSSAAWNCTRAGGGGLLQIMIFVKQMLLYLSVFTLYILHGADGFRLEYSFCWMLTFTHKGCCIDLMSLSCICQLSQLICLAAAYIIDVVLTDVKQTNHSHI